MGIFKRALLFLSRNKLKSLILNVITLTIGIVIYIVVTSVFSLNQEIKNQNIDSLPSFTVVTDYDALMSDYPTGNYPIKLNFTELSDQEVTQIQESEYWKSTSSITNLSFAVDPNQSFEFYDPKLVPYTNNQETTAFLNDIINISGIDNISNNNLNDDVTINYQFTDQELTSNARVIVLNDEYMKLNNLEIGDKIKIAPTELNSYTATKQDVNQISNWLEFEIVGNFTYNPSEEDISIAQEELVKMPDINPNDKFIREYSQMYIPITTMNEIAELARQDFLTVNDVTEDQLLEFSELHNEYYRMQTQVTSTFYYDDVKNKELFLNDITSIISTEKYLTAVEDSKNVLIKFGVLGSIYESSLLILICTIIIGTMLLSFVIILFLKERQAEIGILLSLGESKMKIFLQLIIEMGLVVCSGFLFSIPIGQIFCVQLSNVNVEQLLNPNSSMYYPIYNNTLEFSILTIISFCLLGFSLTILSSVIPFGYILKINPKKMLM